MKAELIAPKRSKAVDVTGETVGLVESQTSILALNPYVEALDHKSYELAKKHRTSLVTGRVAVQKKTKELKALNLETKRAVDAEINERESYLISITKEAEDKQQAEVKRYEAEKEAIRLEKIRLEEERIAGIKAAMNESYLIIKNKAGSTDTNKLESLVQDLHIEVDKQRKELNFAEFIEDYTIHMYGLEASINESIFRLKEEQRLKEQQEALFKEQEQLARDKAALDAEKEKIAEAEAKIESVKKPVDKSDEREAINSSDEYMDFIATPKSSERKYMKNAKVLFTHYGMEGGQEILRVYLEEDYDQADKDRSQLEDSTDKYVKLVEVEIYNK